MSDCLCGLDGEWTICIESRIYGPCGEEICGGACDFVGDCDCPCHKKPEEKS